MKNSVSKVSKKDLECAMRRYGYSVMFMPSDELREFLIESKIPMARCIAISAEIAVRQKIKSNHIPFKYQVEREMDHVVIHAGPEEGLQEYQS